MKRYLLFTQTAKEADSWKKLEVVIFLEMPIPMGESLCHLVRIDVKRYLKDLRYIYCLRNCPYLKGQFDNLEVSDGNHDGQLNIHDY